LAFARIGGFLPVLAVYSSASPNPSAFIASMARKVLRLMTNSWARLGSRITATPNGTMRSRNVSHRGQSSGKSGARRPLAIPNANATRRDVPMHTSRPLRTGRPIARKIAS
jgi:hypothetical protein